MSKKVLIIDEQLLVDAFVAGNTIHVKESPIPAHSVAVDTFTHQDTKDIGIIFGDPSDHSPGADLVEGLVLEIVPPEEKDEEQNSEGNSGEETDEEETDEAEPDEAEPEEAGLSVLLLSELEQMTKAQLIELASERFGLSLPIQATKNAIINEILAAQAGQGV